jgi:hypothetical protein
MSTIRGFRHCRKPGPWPEAAFRGQIGSHVTCAANQIKCGSLRWSH